MFAKKITAAVDLGAHSLKYVEVETDSATVRKAWKGAVRIDAGAPSAGASGATHGVLWQGLVRQLQSEATPPSRVVTALQGEGTWVQYLEFPALSSAELKVAAQAAACKIIPFSLSQVVLSTVPVPALHPNRSGMLVVAALREPAAELSTLFDACGLTIQRMEVVPLALAREFHRNHPDRADAFVALVNVGFSLTHVLVLRRGLPYYVREFPVGGQHFVHGVQRSERIGWDEAEKRFAEQAPVEGHNASEPAMREWSHEVQRSIAHFTDKIAAGSAVVEEVWLSGGCSAWKGLAARAAADLGRPVEVDGWQRIRWGAGEAPIDAGAWKAAVGMALGA